MNDRGKQIGSLNHQNIESLENLRCDAARIQCSDDSMIQSSLTPEELLGSCPVPKSRYDHILLGHGSGGMLTADLIQKMFVPAFNNNVLARMEDQATLTLRKDEEKQEIRNPKLEIRNKSKILNPKSKPDSSFILHPSSLSTDRLRIAFTTDSFVVHPLFFPGGDIGSLAVHGTVNDLAVGGAKPLFLSAAFILEEGLAMTDLARIVDSMRRACEEAGVALVTGDTKVVDRGKGDQMFITTSGIGVVPDGLSLSISNAQPGDVVIASGTIGDHGIAIMSIREGIEFESAIESDSASLAELTQAMLEVCPSIHCMRDPTRGGVSSSLNELATASHVGVVVDESKLPLRPEVSAACAMLGLDPLYVANEGKLLAIVPEADAERLLAAMQAHPLGKNAAVIGQIVDDHHGMVILKSLVGGERVVTMLSGEQLPRIC